LAYRAFYALPAENFSTHTGQHTNAVYGFTSMLINVLRDEAPTHIAVAFDVSRQTFRTEAYAEYKAGRSATPREFEGQISLVQEILGALRIPFVQVEGYEADDVIATLTTMATDEGMDVLICSGDRDAFQLVTDHVTVLYPVRGVSELWRMTPAAVTEKYGVPPTRYSDLAALVGESSDNLPGVPGVGPKTAAKWIGMYAGLDGIVANIDQIGGKAGESLREHLDSVLRNRRLNQLVHDLQVGVELGDLARHSWDREEVHEVFDALEFRVLRERLFATFEAPEPEADSGFALDGQVLGSAEVTGWLAQHAPAGVRTGLQVLGRWGRGTGDARGLALATGAGAAAYVDLAGLDDVGERALAHWLADPTRPKAIHDGKGPAAALAARGLDLAGVTSDTALAAYLVKPDQRDYDLADLAVRLLRRELRDDTTDTGQGMLDFGEGDNEANEAMVTARAVVDLADALDVELERIGSPPRCVRRRRMPGRRSGDATSTSAPQATAGGALRQLGMPKTKRTKTGYTTDADALTELYRQDRAPLPRGPAAPSRCGPAAGDRRGADQVVSPTTDASTRPTMQTIAATGRLSPRPTPTCRTSRSAPRRVGGSGRCLRRRVRVRVPHVGGLQPDRDADHGAPVRATTGSSRRSARVRTCTRFVGVPGLRGRPADGDTGDAQQDQGDVLRPGLRPVGVRPVQAVGDLHRRGQALMDEYFERFGGVRDYLHRCRRRGSGHGVHRDDARAPALPARPDSATTGSAARWPSGWPSTPRSRGRPPTS
jgi:DNA polymerase-1